MNLGLPSFTGTPRLGDGLEPVLRVPLKEATSWTVFVGGLAGARRPAQELPLRLRQRGRRRRHLRASGRGRGAALWRGRALHEGGGLRRLGMGSGEGGDGGG